MPQKFHSRTFLTLAKSIAREFASPWRIIVLFVVALEKKKLELNDGGDGRADRKTDEYE